MSENLRRSWPWLPAAGRRNVSPRHAARDGESPHSWPWLPAAERRFVPPPHAAHTSAADLSTQPVCAPPPACHKSPVITFDFPQSCPREIWATQAARTLLKFWIWQLDEQLQSEVAKAVCHLAASPSTRLHPGHTSGTPAAGPAARRPGGSISSSGSAPLSSLLIVMNLSSAARKKVAETI